MDAAKSFKGYGRAHDAEDEAFRRKSRYRCIVITVASVVLVAAVVGAVVGVIVNKSNSESGGVSSATPSKSPATAIRAVCGVTQHPESCFYSISSLNTSSSDPEDIFKQSLRVAIDESSRITSLPDRLAANVTDPRLKSALGVCKDVLEDAVAWLNDTISHVDADGTTKTTLSSAKVHDIRSWLSTTLTDQETCIDALDEINSTLVDDVRYQTRNATEFASNSLSIAAKIVGLLGQLNVPINRRRLMASSTPSEFPRWVGAGDRRLLAEAVPVADMTVAQDGSGTHKTIGAAVAAVPEKSLKRVVIYVKRGTYKEIVTLEKNKWNVMMYGDGIDATVVSGSLNVFDGTSTYRSATFAVSGKGFIARDMTFINTAGAEKHQAVAFRSGSDESVYYRCSFDAFQDTLYAYSNRQFYRDCVVTGTVDFIFGNAAAVFQNCTIQPRQPMTGQFNAITAHGKKEPAEETGLAFQGCTFTPLGNVTAETYLGRPWKSCATTVIMSSYIGPFLQENGWKSWVSGEDPPSTIYYGEYNNTGPGSSVEKRVNWTGYKPAMTQAEALKFSAESFIQASAWLPATNVAYDPSL